MDDIFSLNAEKARELSRGQTTFQAALRDVLERVQWQAQQDGAEQEITRSWESGEYDIRDLLVTHLEGMGYTVGDTGFSLRVLW